jgi:hypothetical protein
MKKTSHYRGPILVETLEIAAQQMYVKFLFWAELRRTSLNLIDSMPLYDSCLITEHSNGGGLGIEAIPTATCQHSLGDETGATAGKRWNVKYNVFGGSTLFNFPNLAILITIMPTKNINTISIGNHAMVSTIRD